MNLYFAWSYVCHFVGTKMNMMRPSPLFHQANIVETPVDRPRRYCFSLWKILSGGIVICDFPSIKRLLFPIINRSQLLWRQTKKFEDLVSMLKLELDPSTTMDMFLVHLGGDTQKLSASKQERGSLSKEYMCWYVCLSSTYAYIVSFQILRAGCLHRDVPRAVGLWYWPESIETATNGAKKRSSSNIDNRGELTIFIFPQKTHSIWP